MVNVSRPQSNLSTRIGDLNRDRAYRVGRRIRSHLPLELHRQIDRHVNDRPNGRRGTRYSRLHLESIRRGGNSDPMFFQDVIYQVDHANVGAFIARQMNAENRQSFISNQRHMRAQIRSNVGRRNLRSGSSTTAYRNAVRTNNLRRARGQPEDPLPFV